MFRFFFLALISLFPPLYANLLATERTTLKPKPHYSQIAESFARKFPQEHITRLPLDDMISSRTWTNYLSSLDYERVYFLASDIAKFKMDELNLEDKLKNGDINFAHEVFEVFKQRVRNRCKYVNLLLESKFDLEKDESYKWSRKEAPWPRDETEWNEIWRKKIKNEYIRQLVARELATQRTDVADNEKEDEEAPTPEEFIQKRYKQFLTVLDDSDCELVLQKYLSAFSSAYDPHSEYMPPGFVEDFNIQMRLSLVGIGALLRAEDGAAKVVRLIPGGPADRDKREKRLKPGDKIIAVGQSDNPSVDILHWPLYKIVRLIRGKKGTKVVLTVIPASDPIGSTTKQVDLIRDAVKLEEQAAKWRIEQVTGSDGRALALGIITLPAFYANVSVKSPNNPDYKSSAHDVEKILGQMNKKNVEGIILDLRNNGGGFLPEAVNMTGLFIKTGPIVQVKERHGKKVLYDNDPDIAYSGPLVVLVNRLSASASEILAGALQDYGRAVIVGDTKTHGKGTVQAILEVNRDGRSGSIKITSAMYYRISGSSTQLNGISPDIVVASPFDYMEFGEDFLPNALAWSMENGIPYSPLPELNNVIPVLREKSRKRRHTEPRFVAYTKLLNRIDAMNKAEELPLNITQRKKLAKTEKELYDFQREVSPEDEEEQKNNQNKNHDPVLDESLKILTDLIEMEEGEPQPQPAEEHAQKDFFERLMEWLL